MIIDELVVIDGFSVKLMVFIKWVFNIVCFEFYYLEFVNLLVSKGVVLVFLG